MNTDKSIKQAKKGNEIFNQFCNTQSWCKVNKFSNDEYSSWDAGVFSATTKCITEIKVRGKKYDEMLLEVGKLDGLKKTQTELRDKKGIDSSLIYVNHLPNNETLIWDITNINMNDYRITQRWLQKSDYDDTLILKDVIMLPITNAVLKQ